MSLFGKVLDLIYPPRCPICRVFLSKDNAGEDTGFCRDCFAGFRKITSPLCPVCGKPFLPEADEDHWCEECLRKRPRFRALGAPYVYEGSLMTAIHQYKYGTRRYLGHPLGRLLAAFAVQWVERPVDLLTMPVPLNTRRLRERGFNQSLELAKHVALGLGTELNFLSLKRVRYTKPQTGLGKEDRRKNVRKAFDLARPETVKGRRILLVDDVATTGSTLNECARVLRRAKSKDVLCLVLARTGPL